jgi:hypothetical protein
MPLYSWNFRSRRQIKGFGTKTIRYCNYSWFCRKYYCGAANLPGTQTVGEEPDCFVRGGENETQTFVDGIRVAQPYGATTNNLPTEDDFLPFIQRNIISTGVTQQNMVKPCPVFCY